MRWQCEKWNLKENGRTAEKEQETQERKEAVRIERQLGHNRLTDNLIDTFRSYYKKALQENESDLQNIQKAVKASWYSYASIEDNQMHDYCPKGNNSWCKWQKDQANGTSSFKPENVVPAVMQEILPTFDSLWAENLLQSVLESLSQNNNDVQNHLVCDISPK